MICCIILCKFSTGGLFDNGRIDRDSLPDGWYAYDLGENNEGEISELKNGIVTVNHYGTFLTQNKLPLAEGEVLFAGNGFDYDFAS